MYSVYLKNKIPMKWIQSYQNNPGVPNRVLLLFEPITSLEFSHGSVNYACSSRKIFRIPVVAGSCPYVRSIYN